MASLNPSQNAVASAPLLSPNKKPIKTALHQAVIDRRLHQVRLLVTHHGVNVDTSDVFGRTPLMYACLLDDEELAYKMVKIFLCAGAFINTKDKMGRTAFIYACMKGRAKIAEKFLNKVTLEMLPDNDGNTPLHHAALSGHPEVVSTVIETMTSYCMSPDHRNEMGYTALLLACKYGHYVSAYNLLTKAKASPTIRDNEFFLNAMEWVERSGRLISKSLEFYQENPESEMRMSFSREHTMYGPNLSRQCHHWSPPKHPLGRSLGSALKLPPVFQLQKSFRDENVLNGRDARHTLLLEIEKVLSEQESRPSSRSPKRKQKKHPKTAKLREISETNKRIPDMNYIFQAYSDQCDLFKPKRKSVCINLSNPPRRSTKYSLPAVKVMDVNASAENCPA